MATRAILAFLTVRVIVNELLNSFGFNLSEVSDPSLFVKESCSRILSVLNQSQGVTAATASSDGGSGGSGVNSSLPVSPVTTAVPTAGQSVSVSDLLPTYYLLNNSLILYLTFVVAAVTRSLVHVTGHF